jgi:hypothetical protein
LEILMVGVGFHFFLLALWLMIVTWRKLKIKWDQTHIFRRERGNR